MWIVEGRSNTTHPPLTTNQFPGFLVDMNIVYLHDDVTMYSPFRLLLLWTSTKQQTLGKCLNEHVQKGRSPPREAGPLKKGDWLKGMTVVTYRILLVIQLSSLQCPRLPPPLPLILALD
jgi:hypothetical protein